MDTESTEKARARNQMSATDQIFMAIEARDTAEKVKRAARTLRDALHAASNAAYELRCEGARLNLPEAKLPYETLIDNIRGAQALARQIEADAETERRGRQRALEKLVEEKMSVRAVAP